MMKICWIVLFISLPILASNEAHIQVQGNCEMKVIPDRGTITFTAENQSKDQKEAVKKTIDQINKLKSSLETLALKNLELKNTHYNVYPVREYEKERYLDKGIRATLTLEVTTSEISRIGETMILASKAGILNVGSLITFLSLEKSQEEYLKCLDIAAMDARNKAQQLGKKLGFKIGEVIALIEGPIVDRSKPNPERSMMKTWGDVTETATTQIESGTEQYSSNIQVTFSIK